MRTRTAALLLSLVVALSLAACGSSGASGGGSVSAAGAWVRAVAAGGTSAAYMTLTNGTSAEDALVGVSTTAAASTGLHETSTDASGMTGMQPVDQIAIPAGGTVTLEPGGYHVMLMDLAGELAAGQLVTLTLTFEHAGTLDVQAEVKAS